MGDEKPLQDVLVDEHGQIVPMDPRDVRRTINAMLNFNKGRLIAYVVELNGELAVNILDVDDPEKVAAILTQAAKQLRHATRGQRTHG